MKTLTALLLVVCSVCILALAGCSSNKSSLPNSIADSPVEWHQWNKKAFDQAKSADKLVFLYIEPFWCEPCMKMKQHTFTDPAIAKLLSDNFVSIYVDGEKDPSLYERYQLGTYPSCVILTSSGGMIGGSNALPPDSLSVLLTRVLDVKKSQPDLIDQQADRLEQQFRERAEKTEPGRPSEEIVNNTEDALLSLYDSTYYGFGNQPKYLIPEALKFMLSGVSPKGLVYESELRNTLNAQLALYDSVWGGFGRSARFADWSEVNHEKLLDLNAEMAMLYQEAGQLMEDTSYSSIAVGTLEYITRFLSTKESWGFYNSQRGMLPGKLDAGYNGEKAYFSLSQSQRLEQGTPEIDSTAYAASTAKAVSALLRVGRVVGREDWISYALNTLDKMIENDIGGSGVVQHQLLPASKYPAGLLPDQNAVASALIDAYETSGKKDYLDKAELVAAFMVDHLEDKRLGGFALEPPFKDPLGREKVRIKPYIHNAQAVWVFTRLYYLTAESKYQRPAETTLRYVITKPTNKKDIRLPYLAMAYLNLTRYPSLIAMVGEQNDDYKQLLAQLWKDYYPREIVVHLGNGDKQQKFGQLTIPATSRPEMFACGYDTLSAAIFEPAKVRKEVGRFLTHYELSRK